MSNITYATLEFHDKCVDVYNTEMNQTPKVDQISFDRWLEKQFLKCLQALDEIQIILNKPRI